MLRDFFDNMRLYGIYIPFSDMVGFGTPQLKILRRTRSFKPIWTNVSRSHATGEWTFWSFLGSIGWNIDFQTFEVRFSESRDQTAPVQNIKIKGQEKVGNRIFFGDLA